MEAQFNPKEIIATLVKSPHGELNEYRSITADAVRANPEFYAHLTAWNHLRGQVRDARVALPVGALHVKDQQPEFLENALALMVTLPTRDYVRALSLSKEWNVHSRTLRRLVSRKLRDLESSRKNWEKVAIQHRDTLRRLYALYHIAPGGAKDSFEDVALMKGAATTGKFAVVRDLSKMPATQIGAMVKQHKLPFLIARGALGARAKEPEVALALIESMTPTEVVINTKALVRMGVKTVPALRAAYEEAIAKVGTTKRSKKGTSTLRTTKIAEALEDEGDAQMATKVRAAQERQLQQLGSIEGDWAVLSDCSSSMRQSIETARQVAALLARMVKGKVHLVFFNTDPRYFDVTGKTYDEITSITKNVIAAGGTLIGVGLDYLLQRGIEVQGIAIVSDGGENRPGYATSFPSVFKKYVTKFNNEPTVYLYKLQGDPDLLTPEAAQAGVRLETFDLQGKNIDAYSLPNLVATMRVSRYSLVDEIYATPLLTLDSVLTHTVGVEVVKREKVTA